MMDVDIQISGLGSRSNMVIADMNEVQTLLMTPTIAGTSESLAFFLAFSCSQVERIQCDTSTIQLEG